MLCMAPVTKALPLRVIQISHRLSMGDAIHVCHYTETQHLRRVSEQLGGVCGGQDAWPHLDSPEDRPALEATLAGRSAAVELGEPTLAEPPWECDITWTSSCTILWNARARCLWGLHVQQSPQPVCHQGLPCFVQIIHHCCVIYLN